MKKIYKLLFPFIRCPMVSGPRDREYRYPHKKNQPPPSKEVFEVRYVCMYVCHRSYVVLYIICVHGGCALSLGHVDTEMFMYKCMHVCVPMHGVFLSFSLSVCIYICTSIHVSMYACMHV